MTKQAQRPLRLVTLEQVESIRSGGKFSAEIQRTAASALLEAGWVYEIPAHEWVGPEGERGRVCYDHTETEAWLQGPAPTLTVWWTLNGVNPIAPDPASKKCCAGYKLLPSKVADATVEAHDFDCPALGPDGCNARNG